MVLILHRSDVGAQFRGPGDDHGADGSTDIPPFQHRFVHQPIAQGIELGRTVEGDLLTRPLVSTIRNCSHIWSLCVMIQRFADYGAAAHPVDQAWTIVNDVGQADFAFVMRSSFPSASWRAATRARRRSSLGFCTLLMPYRVTRAG